jgi:hypothetical protein
MILGTLDLVSVRAPYPMELQGIDTTSVLNHTLKTLNNLKIPCTNATTYSHTTDPSCLVILSILNEADGWVMVDTSASDTT